MTSYQQMMARNYYSRVKPKFFRCGDLISRRAKVSKPTEQGKLAPNWEGSYRVSEVIHPRPHRIKELDGTPIP